MLSFVIFLGQHAFYKFVPTAFCRWELVDGQRLWTEESVHLLIPDHCMKTTKKHSINGWPSQFVCSSISVTITDNISIHVACHCVHPSVFLNKLGIFHLCVCFICAQNMKKYEILPQPWQSLFILLSSVSHKDLRQINNNSSVTHFNLDKTLMIIFHLCIQSSLYRLGSQVKTICYNLVPGKCKSTFQIRWNKNHAVHYILYS